MRGLEGQLMALEREVWHGALVGYNESASGPLISRDLVILYIDIYISHLARIVIKLLSYIDLASAHPSILHIRCDEPQTLVM